MGFYIYINQGANQKFCSHKECSNNAKKEGVCWMYGAKLKVQTCNYEEYTNYVRLGGVYIKHGAKRKQKSCSHEGYINSVRVGGVCIKHGTKFKTCSHEKDATNMSKEKESAEGKG